MALAPMTRSVDGFAAPAASQPKPPVSVKTTPPPPAAVTPQSKDTFTPAPKPAQTGGTGGPVPVPPPTDPANRSEVPNLWQDLHVPAAQALLPQSPPGKGQSVAVLDFSFKSPGDHGYYVTEIASGPSGSALPGIAAGAHGTGVTWDTRAPNLGQQLLTGLNVAGLLIGHSNLENQLKSNMAANAPSTIELAYQQNG